MEKWIRALGLVLVVAQAAQPQGPPPSARRPVTDQFHGVSVTDPYRWLDDWNDPAVRAWTEEQNRYTRAALDALPFAAAVRDRVKAIGSAAQPVWFALSYRQPQLFALKAQPPLNQPRLVAMPASDLRGERVIVDPNTLDPSGQTTIDFYAPSANGRLVAVSLSKGGTEEGDVHVFETDSGRERADRVPRVNGGTAGGSVAWNADGTGFFYTRYPRGGERPPQDRDFFQQIYFHALGTPTEADVYSLGRDFPRIAEIALESSRDGRFVLAHVNNGDGGERAYYLRSAATGQWRQIAAFSDGVSTMIFAGDGSLYALSHRNAPHGAIIRMEAGAPGGIRGGHVIYRATDGGIQDVVASARHLYISQIVGGPFELHVTDLDGSGDRTVPLPPVSSIGELLALDGDRTLFRSSSFVEPTAWYRLSPESAPSRTPLASGSPVDFSGIAIVRAEAVSKDGTRVPMTILHRKSMRRDGANPAILYGYGGYGASVEPFFSAMNAVWLEQGGILALANTRGGSEFGEAWHQAGYLTHKQNVFDDFFSCARFLIDQRYTSTAKLALEGASNGGLLMGAMLTQHPDLARAIVSRVGIYDMMRFELWPNGAFNVTEYGSVKDLEQFRALFAYSPYQRVVPNTEYPAVLLLSGTNDPRVNPGDSRRLAARLQASTSSGRPVFLRVSGGGHIGNGLEEGMAEAADIYTFLFWQLGVEYRPAK